MKGLVAAPIAVAAILYVGGYLAQFIGNYALWKEALHQNPVQFRITPGIAQQPQQHIAMVVIGQVIEMTIVPIQQEKTACLAVPVRKDTAESLQPVPKQKP